MSTKPNPRRLNYDITAAANLALNKIKKAADHPQATPRSLAAAILPEFGIKWNREVIDAVAMGGRRVTHEIEEPPTLSPAAI